jgi:hypothetical protein
VVLQYGYPSYPYPPPLVVASTGAPPSYTYPPPPVIALMGVPLSYPYPPSPPYGYPLYPYSPPPVAASTGAPPPYSYLPPPAYPYPPHQPTHSGGGDNSGGGKNIPQMTQALGRIKKRNEWTRGDEEKLVGLQLILSLSFFSLLCCTYKSFLHVYVWLIQFMDCIECNVKPGAKF